MSGDWKNDPKFLELKADTRLRGIAALFERSEELTDITSVSESPIEELMLHALSLIEVPLYFNDMATHPSAQPTPIVATPPYAISDAKIEKIGDIVFLFPQHQIGPYRVDFLIVAKFCGSGPYRIVVECDGHEFHEKTKDQAERDKSRDRYLAQEGCTVLRFTGREIWRDAFSCAQEVKRLLDRLEYETKI